LGRGCERLSCSLATPQSPNSIPPSHVQDGAWHRSDAAQLAQHLFSWGEAKTLLLSATPYKPFSLAEEREDNHYDNLLSTLGFLARGMAQDAEPWLAAVAAALEDFRAAAVHGQDTVGPAGMTRALLLQVMCRTERPQQTSASMFSEHAATTEPPRTEDLLEYVELRRLATEVGGPLPIEYWKSAPYFASFLDGYQVGSRLRERLKVSDDAQRQALVGSLRHLVRADVERFKRIDMGNPRLRRLADETVGQGWWQLLWMPPSLLYSQPSGPFAVAAAATITKRLVFSSWTATPTAIAALLSYEAERQLDAGSQRQRANTAEGRRRIGTRLDYRLNAAGRPQAMTTLALFWPHPGLAALADPLAIARTAPTETLTAEELTRRATARLSLGRDTPVEPAEQDEEDSRLWQVYFSLTGTVPGNLTNTPAAVVAGYLSAGLDGDGAERDSGRVADHVALVLGARSSGLPAADRATTELVARLGLHAPANIAWRALGRLLNGESQVTEEGRWVAASRLAAGFRSLFNRSESIILLDALYPDDPYWQKILRYCAAGNLQSVMDEYLHHLRDDVAMTNLNDAGLLEVATYAADALSLRTSRYAAFDPTNPDVPIGFTCRFALRYGSREGETDTARPGEVRRAFNSPFWPFVLTTTSAGQEGVDFHWWSHAVVHWNTPANPVDFEQREGRVSRFGGHAVRRNIAAAHRQDVLASSEPSPWKAAYDAALNTPTGLGEFAPYWLYPGAATVERHLYPFPLSRDEPRTQRLKDDLALYRLAFGQPRQEDLLGLLRRNGAETPLPEPIDLRPPVSLT
jgi:hypothetical protein